MIRYLFMIGLHASYGLVTLVAATAIGVWAQVLDPGELDTGLGLVLCVQMFLASTGYLPRARRGHFDPLIVRYGDGRSRFLAAHYLASLAPGATAWLVLIVVSPLLGGRFSFVPLLRRVVALFVVSALAWAAGTPLPRGGAALVWAVALVSAVSLRVSFLPVAHAPQDLHGLGGAAALLLCPFLLLGNMPRVSAALLASVAASASAAAIAAAAFVARADLPLVERS